MKRYVLMIAVALTLCAVSVGAQTDTTAFDRYSLWLGGHYTDFNDYAKKVGEYRLIDDNVFGEFRLDLLSRRGSTLFSLNGHFFDEKNILGQVNVTTGNRLAASFQYRSLVHQLGQDLLSNLAAREAINGAPGGKMLTHEILDPGADYNIHRQEVLSTFDVLLSERGNVHMVAAHRMILREGTDQSRSVSHCFSCHAESRTRQVQNTTHNLELGLQADLTEDKTIGYRFGYRQFKSDAPDAYAPYDDAKHPTAITNAGTEAEFDSRQAYEDTTLRVNALPQTEKMSHRVRFKGNLGKGRFSTALGYARTENQETDLSSDAVTGTINYSHPLGDQTRLVAKVYAARQEADDPFIDLPTYRAGRPGGAAFANLEFDYTRYSVIDRTHARATAEVIHRLNPRWTVSVLGGYEMIDRDDYPVADDGLQTKRFIGQIGARFRKGLNYSSRMKYRFEKTSDPFVSGRGLFEYPGVDSLARDWNGTGATFGFIFYHDREDLRYQAITTEPTDFHQFEWNSNWQATPKVGLSIGVRGFYDKNSDLDSLDVSHFSFIPNLNVNLTPSDKLAATVGYTYNHYKSRGPVSVALFDG